MFLSQLPGRGLDGHDRFDSRTAQSFPDDHLFDPLPLYLLQLNACRSCHGHGPLFEHIMIFPFIVTIIERHPDLRASIIEWTIAYCCTANGSRWRPIHSMIHFYPNRPRPPLVCLRICLPPTPKNTSQTFPDFPKRQNLVKCFRNDRLKNDGALRAACHVVLLILR